MKRDPFFGLRFKAEEVNVDFYLLTSLIGLGTNKLMYQDWRKLEIFLFFVASLDLHLRMFLSLLPKI